MKTKNMIVAMIMPSLISVTPTSKGKVALVLVFSTIVCQLSFCILGLCCCIVKHIISFPSSYHLLFGDNWDCTHHHRQQQRALNTHEKRIVQRFEPCQQPLTRTTRQFLRPQHPQHNHGIFILLQTTSPAKSRRTTQTTCKGRGAFLRSS